MRIAINAVCIKDDSILLLKKRDVWILPGGKPVEGESELDCLKRECREEIPKTNLPVVSWFGEFTGTTPHTGDILLAKVYFGEVEGDITPGAEISESRYFRKDELPLIPISDITKKIIVSLIDSGHLK
jgi:8-oxo-dGTP diphosphatase